MGFPEPAETKLPALPALTGLRFVAALAIVVHHYAPLLDLPPVIRALATEARTGVGLFFVLSGCVLAYNYFGWFVQDHHRYGQFLWARFTRIVPMHVVALVLTTPVVLAAVAPALAHPLRGLDAESVVLGWLANLFLVHAFLPAPTTSLWNVPAWSISAELFFYLTFPFFIRHVLGRVSRGRSVIGLLVGLVLTEVVIFALALVAFVVGLPAEVQQQPMALARWFWLPPLRVWEFFLGCTLGLLLWRSRQGQPAWLPALLQRRWGRDVTVTMVLIALPAGALAVRFMPATQAAMTLDPYVLYTPFFALLILALASGRTVLTRLLEHPWMLRLGEASYSLYLIHWSILVGLTDVLLVGQRVPPWLVPVAIIVTIVASLPCYLFVERPVQRRLRGWRMPAWPIRAPRLP
jgi:peptidoglycan/LPS O-acetylase OafA/YrhL